LSQPKYRQIINCGLTILIVSLFSLYRLRNTTRLKPGTVDKSKWPIFLQNASGNSIHTVFYFKPISHKAISKTFYFYSGVQEMAGKQSTGGFEVAGSKQLYTGPTLVHWIRSGIEHW